MALARMRLKILLPSRVFGELEEVARIVAEAQGGAFGILPNRLDCVAALLPGILTYTIGTGAEVYVAVDEGVLVKTGPEVLVSVRHAIGGPDLGQLRQAVEQEFLALNEREKTIRTAVAKLESGLIRRFAEFHHA